MYTIEFTRVAKKALLRLPSDLRERVFGRIRELKAAPRPDGSVQMRGSHWRRHRRLRVGDYRIVYRVEDEVCVVTVVRIGHRSSVYER